MDLGFAGGPRPTSVPVRAIAVDIDGTLLDPSHRITSATRGAVTRLVDRGVHVVLATSRYPLALLTIQQELDILGEFLVACQGAVVARFRAESLGRPLDNAVDALEEHLMEPAAAEALTSLGRKLGFGVSYYTATTWLAETGDPMVDQEAAITGRDPTLVARLDPALHPPAKVALMAPARLVHRVPEALSRIPAGLEGTVSRPDYIEVVEAGTSKWAAFTAVLRHYGIEQTASAAIGDGTNDLTMISNARIGIAMAHAPAEVRAAAGWIAPSNAADGFAAAVGRILAEPADT